MEELKYDVYICSEIKSVKNFGNMQIDLRSEKEKERKSEVTLTQQEQK